MSEQIIEPAPPEQAPGIPDTPVPEGHDLNATIPGTKITYGDAERLGIPDIVVDMIPHMAEQAGGRKLGVVNANGEWFIYRSISRREFKNVVTESADRAIKQAEAAEQAGKPLSPAHLNAETQGYLEEKIAADCTLHPRLSMARMGEYDAGLPKVLHDSIMLRSSFDQQAQPIAL
jgi:hypothetical protein